MLWREHQVQRRCHLKVCPVEQPSRLNRAQEISAKVETWHKWKWCVLFFQIHKLSKRPEGSSRRTEQTVSTKGHAKMAKVSSANFDNDGLQKEKTGGWVCREPSPHHTPLDLTTNKTVSRHCFRTRFLTHYFRSKTQRDGIDPIPHNTTVPHRGRANAKLTTMGPSHNLLEHLRKGTLSSLAVIAHVEPSGHLQSLRNKNQPYTCLSSPSTASKEECAHCAWNLACHTHTHLGNAYGHRCGLPHAGLSFT